MAACLVSPVGGGGCDLGRDLKWVPVGILVWIWIGMTVGTMVGPVGVGYCRRAANMAWLQVAGFMGWWQLADWLGVGSVVWLNSLW